MDTPPATKKTEVPPPPPPVRPIGLGKRTRAAVELEVKGLNVSGGFQFLTLEALLDIRDLLQALLDKK